MIMMSGLNYGIRRSLPHYWGIILGFTTMLILVGLGLGAIFAASPSLHLIVKWLGSAYILYLAWKTVSATTVSTAPEVRRPLSMGKTILFQCANPKAWVMSIGVFATFSHADGGGVLAQVLWISLIFTLVLMPCIATWLVGGVMLRSILTNPMRLKICNWIMGGLLALSVILMLRL